MPHTCSLVCWTCGKTAPIEVTGPPQFAFEIAGWAKDIGWIGAMDMHRGRVLVFCSHGCCEEAKTKQGMFRARAQRRTAPNPS